VASDAELVEARCDPTPIAVLEAGAVRRDLEPAARPMLSIDAKLESAAGNDLAFAWLRELA
jgi:hypothetical protein